MGSILDYLFGAAAYVPHGFCLLWRPDLVALHAVSDGLIALAYFSIPAALLIVARRRPDLAYRPVFLLFALFILGCGVTHVIGLVTLWYPVYGLQGLAKAGTALVSVIAALAVWPLMPRLLQLPSPSTLQASNAQLSLEIAQRRDAEAKLRYLNEHLEREVAGRLSELAEANRSLLAEARERERAEADMRRTVDELAFMLQTREELEQRVAERTRELEQANAQLAAEIDERGRIEAELRMAVTRLERYMTNTPLAVIERVIPADGSEWQVERWTGQAEAIFGWKSDEVIGRSLHEIGMVPPDQRDRARQFREDAVAGRFDRLQVTVPNVTKSGARRTCTWYHSFFWDVAPGTARVFSLLEDVTERTLALERAEWLATHDPLTRLPNRALFQDRLVQAIASAKRRGERLAVMMIDLDRFKLINDSCGHAIGDAVLQQQAARIAGSVRESDTVARLAGDEFALVQTELDRATNAEVMARRLMMRAGEPLAIAGQRLDGSFSVGIAIFPDHGGTPDELLRAADLALYRAKRAGRAGYRIYDQHLDGDPAGSGTLDPVRLAAS